MVVIVGSVLVMWVVLIMCIGVGVGDFCCVEFFDILVGWFFGFVEVFVFSF